jgi:hypothetical protein
MARIRTVKPEFFRHEGLQDLEQANPGRYPMLVFAGLFGHCDKGGVFEWKPRTLKLDILPFLNFDMAETLAILEKAGQVQRFEVDGKCFGFIPSFTEHQSIGGKESQAPVKFPRPDGEIPETNRGSDREVSETAGREGKGREQVKRAAPASLSLLPVDLPHGLDEAAWTRWLGYRRETGKPLKPASHQSAMKALAKHGEDQSAVVEQSIANGWQGLFALKGNDSKAKGAQDNGLQFAN